MIQSHRTFNKKRIYVRILSLILIFSLFVVPVSYEVYSQEEEKDLKLIKGQVVDSSDYTSYLKSYEKVPHPKMDSDVIVKAGNYKNIYNDGGYKVLESYEGMDDVLLVESSLQYVEYSFEIETEGLYYLALTHFPLNKGSQYEMSLKINGFSPFRQAEGFLVQNTYESESDQIIKNESGDEFVPSSVVRKIWTTSRIVNPDHNYDEPLMFYFDKGSNDIRLFFFEPETFILGDIRVVSDNNPPEYKDYLKSDANSKGNEFILTEAESSTAQSSSSLRPENDRTDRLTSPYSAKSLLINIIGNSWRQHGQWLEWEINVKKTGYYKLSLRFQQDALKGLPVSRKISIDGAVPFKEARSFQFPYTEKWDTLTVKDDNDEPYLFFLEEGTHTVQMEAVLGEMAAIVREIGSLVYDLNEIYRQIIMITSTSPDKYRDYNLHQEMPELIEAFQRSADQLQQCYESVEKIAKGKIGEIAIIQTLIRQLNSFIKDPRSIPNRISAFQGNIGSLSALVLDIRNQPFMLDYFYFWQDDAKLPQAKSTFIDKIKHSLSMFFYSFIQDYNSYTETEEKETISIWLGTGRDQAEVLWRATADLFTPKTGIAVDVKLVTATMVEAFLSGNAPDVSIHAQRDIPVNLAIRSALLELSVFEGFSEVSKWYHPGALTPYTYHDKVYGLPDMQIFNMMFYRKDILNELGIEVPQTWDEFIGATNQLQMNHLKSGVPVTGALVAGSAGGDSSMYYTLLMQNGGVLFNEDHSRVLLESSESIKAFSMWTDLYKKLGLPVQYDFFNRFRSGEMPLVVAAYNVYNQLMSAAPELRGLWEIAPIPGTMQPCGTINRAQPGSGTAAMILRATTKPEASWEFIKWWAGEEAQTRYAGDLESRIGIIARVPVANKLAFESQEWQAKYRTALKSAWSEVQELPQVPGNYYLDRDLVNAFRDATYNERNSKEVLLEYGKRINDELQRKREEFGLE